MNLANVEAAWLLQRIGGGLLLWSHVRLFRRRMVW